MRHLRAFLAVANTRSFLGAENELFISRQAISKTIDQLESELHTTLFIRNQSGAMMTPSGIYFYSKAAAFVSGFDQLAEDMRSVRYSYVPKIRLGISLGILSLYAGAIDRYALSRQTELSLSYHSCLDSECENILSSQEVDAVISFTPPNTQTADVRTILDSPIVLLASQSDLDEYGEDTAALLNCPHLLYTGGHDRCPWWPDVQRPEDILSSDMTYLLSLLGAGRGVMPVPKFLVPCYLNFDSQALTLHAMPSCRVYFSTRYSSYYDALTNSLLDAVYDEIFLAKSQDAAK